MSELDAYAVVTPLVPQPPEEPDPQAVARETRQALFAQEKHYAWDAPLHPARPGRQRHPAVPEAASQPGDTSGTERSAMCILGTDGGHASRGLHCPHNLPVDGDEDSITRIEL